MRSGQLLFSAVQFLFTLLILLLGGFFVGLHYAPHLSYAIIYAIEQFFIDNSTSFIPIGLSILGCGLLLLIGFCAMHRGIYFRFLIPAKAAAIDAAVFRSTVKKYWSDQFPELDLSTDVLLHRNDKLEICLEMPALPPDDHHKLLEKIETELRALLAGSLGYKDGFSLTVMIKN